MIKLLIADDHAIVRAGLRSVINTELAMQLVGEACGGYEIIDLVEKSPPDVLILDISMPDLDGIAVTKRIKSRFPRVQILILTVHEDEALLRAALRAGASGYILKQAAETELIAAIYTIIGGDLYVDPSMLRSLLADEIPSINSTTISTEELTPRETQVLKLIAHGYTNRQIGEELFISIRTVERHRENLKDKLGLRTRVDLVRYARDQGLIK